MLIRQVQPDDLENLIKVEELCFPPEEAATREAFEYRIAAFPESFFVAVENDEIIGIVNGCVTDSLVISDDLFEPDGGHNPNGKNQAIFGLLVDPEYQKQGVAAALMNCFMDAARTAGPREDDPDLQRAFDSILRRIWVCQSWSLAVHTRRRSLV